MSAAQSIPSLASPGALAGLNQWLASRTAIERVAWALETLPGAHVLSSSFGAQSAVALHLATRIKADLPVIVIDTGFLFPETYRFIEDLRARLELDVRVYTPRRADAWAATQVARLPGLGVDGLARYNYVHKVEPMQRALRELGVGTWIAGLRRAQSESRAQLDFLEYRDGRFKLHPMADWTDRNIGRYLAQHGLPYHPLWHDGFVSIGDTHSTRPWQPGMREEDTRFGGLKRECGLHEPWADVHVCA